MSQYATFSRFGGRIANQNITNPKNLTNPLTYCMVKTMDNAFIHGGTSNIGPSSYQCQNYMADRCADKWDSYCDLYANVNSTLTYWPNSAAISAGSFSSVNAIQPLNVAQQLLRNAAERKYIHYPYVKPSYEPFDPNDAASPYYNKYGSSYGPLKYSIKNIHAKSINKDELMIKVLRQPQACMDVLVRIFQHYQDKKLNLKNTILERFFQKHQNVLTKWQSILYNRKGLNILRDNNRSSYLLSNC